MTGSMIIALAAYLIAQFGDVWTTVRALETNRDAVEKSRLIAFFMHVLGTFWVVGKFVLFNTAAIICVIYDFTVLLGALAMIQAAVALNNWRYVK